MAPNGHSRLFGVRLWLGTASLKRLMKRMYRTAVEEMWSRGQQVRMRHEDAVEMRRPF